MPVKLATYNFKIMPAHYYLGSYQESCTKFKFTKVIDFIIAMLCMAYKNFHGQLHSLEVHCTYEQTYQTVTYKCYLNSLLHIPIS